jgi:tRNA threonylcarbamoyladenosine biosynthesis protein TsaE
MQVTTKTEKQTHSLGKKFAESLRGGEVIALIGDLGAGKTVFTKGLAAGLGIKQIVNSPTFVVMKIYKTANQGPVCRRGRLEIRNLVHIDAYRLKSGNELKGIGIEDYLNKPETITVIEWADRAKDILPKNTKFIYLKDLATGQREIKIVGWIRRDVGQAER